MINPHSMTFHGEPLIGQIPCKVVARGAQPTSAQRQQLQNAYALFCANHRLSIFKNGRVNGKLPDGSTYSISVINGAPQMVVNVVRLEVEQTYKGGIIFYFVALDGNGLADFSENNESGQSGPKNFVLTPGIKKKTRESDGTLKIRVKNRGGGNIIWYQSEQHYYVAGSASERHGRYGAESLNQMAYRVSGKPFENVFKRGYVAGRMGESGSYYLYKQNRCLPFVRRSSENKTWVMQVSIRYIHESGQWFMDLYGEKGYELPRSTDIGTLLYTLEFPSNFTPVESSVSIHPDGRSLRMLCYLGLGFTCKADVKINDDSLSFVGHSLGDGYSAPEEYVKTGSTDLIAGTTMFIRHQAVGDMQSQTTHSKIKECIEYGYDRLGNPVESYLARAGGSGAENYIGIQNYDQDGVATSFSSVYSETDAVRPLSYVLNGHVISEPASSLTRSVTINRSDDGEWTGSHTESYSASEEAAIFYDATHGFVITQRTTSSRNYSAVVASYNYWEGTESNDSTITYRMYHNHVLVEDLGSRTYTSSRGHEMQPLFRFLFASDPRTATLIVSIEEVTTEIENGMRVETVRRCRVYFVDKSGVKPLSSVMTVPNVPYRIEELRST